MRYFTVLIFSIKLFFMKDKKSFWKVFFNVLKYAVTAFAGWLLG